MTGQGAIRPRPCDAVGNETASTLVATQRDARALRESPVHGSDAEPVTAKAKLEHRDVPAHGAEAELALSEKNGRVHPVRASSRVRRVRSGARLVLSGTRSARWSWARPRTPSTGTRVEPVGTEPDLECGDASAGREPAGSEREDTNGHRDANDGEATHAPNSAVASPSSPWDRPGSTATIRPLPSPVAQLAEHPAVNRRVVGSVQPGE